jgi:hypothetical protein
MPCTRSRLRIARTAVVAAGITTLSHALPAAAPSQRGLGTLAQRPAPGRKLRRPADHATTLPAPSGGFRKARNAKR